MLDVPLRYGEWYLEAVAAREGEAGAVSLLPLFAPASVAVIGASRRAASVGNAVVRHLVAAGLRGLVYPVNPHAIRITGRRAYPSVSALPEIPDLAVVAVPAAAVGAVVAECGRCGVRGLVVLSAGLSDEDACRLRRTVRRYGPRRWS